MPIDDALFAAPELSGLKSSWPGLSEPEQASKGMRTMQAVANPELYSQDVFPFFLFNVVWFLLQQRRGK